MDKLKACRNEVRRLIKKTTYSSYDKKHNLMVATYGQFAEYEKLISKLMLVLLLIALHKEDDTS